MKRSISKKLKFTMKNFGITIKEFNDIDHRYECVKWAGLISELKNDLNTNKLALQMAWNKFKAI